MLTRCRFFSLLVYVSIKRSMMQTFRHYVLVSNKKVDTFEFIPVKVEYIPIYMYNLLYFI